LMTSTSLAHRSVASCATAKHIYHWVQSRIQFQLSTLRFRSWTLNQPDYLSAILQSYQPLF